MSVVQWLIGLDIGTSAIKGVLMSSEGTIAARERSGNDYQISENGRIQFDAEQLYRTAADVIRRLAASLPSGSTVEGVSIASASGNTLLVDHRGKPMMPAISWMDTRVRDEIQKVFGELDSRQEYERIGWPLLPQFPLAHLAWIKCHHPELLADSSFVCMTTDYILFRLTGRWGIDRSTATTFYLQDQQAATWHAPYLQQLGILEDKLPPIHLPGTRLGGLTAQAALDTGLAPGTPVVLGAFDHPCAARGAGILDEGQLLLSCGTSWVGFYPVNDRRKAIEQNMLVDPFLQPNGPWGAMRSLPAIAASIDKYIINYLSDGADRYTVFDNYASSAVPGADGLLLHPVLEEPAIDLSAYSKADIARALMEGTVFLLKKQVDDLKAAGIPASTVTMVGGPMESRAWPQIVADVLGVTVNIVNGSCAGAVGAAILAGIGTGLFADERDAWRQLQFPTRTLIPNPTRSTNYQQRFQQFMSKYE
ncbi:xylulokinase [Cohnella soli]|uniref:FGGY-family carbohydrate kinase n=1 Tax=Cohnella soli TaxID=425005 RepID=A0ABW0HJT6_9BACL